MKVSVIGTGYVGLVAGACLAELNHTVICVDIDAEKIRKLENAEIPIYEPGLHEMVQKNVSAKRLSFTTDTEKAVAGSDIIFIAVGTPQGENGEADLSYVLNAAESIGKAMNAPKIIVDKSTVPVGSSRKVKKAIEKHSKFRTSVVSNPEFLREGSAVKDFMEPDRVIIGSDDAKAAETIRTLYAPLNKPVLVTSPESAEMIKYASNAFLATKISFINEIANICEKVGADVSEVSKGMGLDERIGKYFLQAGAGYGGSCFPKDVKALSKISKNSGYIFKILGAVESVNDSQKNVPFEKLKKELGKLEGKKVVVLGLAFKPETDDVREASSIRIINLLSDSGAITVAVDSVARENAKKIFGNLKNLSYSDSAYSAAENADAIVLVTEWKEFLELDFGKVASLMKSKVIVDARNCLDSDKLISLGFNYAGIGRR